MTEPIIASDIAAINTPVLIGNLHGMLFSPRNDKGPRVLMLSPLFEEKRCAHRALVRCASAMADAGAAVLIPDLTGVGNSGGSLREICLEHWRRDIRASVAFLAEKCGPTTLVIGCRLGALLAAHAVAAGDISADLLLWQPVLSGKSYFSQARTRRMVQDKVTGGAPPPVEQHEVEGEVLSPELFRDLQALQMPSTRPPGKITLLQCSFTEKLLMEYERFVEGWGRESITIRSVLAEPFWHPHTPSDYANLTAALAKEVTA